MWWVLRLLCTLVAWLALAQHLYGVTNTPHYPYFSRKACILSCDGFTVWIAVYPRSLFVARPMFVQRNCFCLVSRARHFPFTLPCPVHNRDQRNYIYTEYKFLKKYSWLPTHHLYSFKYKKEEKLQNIYTWVLSLHWSVCMSRGYQFLTLSTRNTFANNRLFLWSLLSSRQLSQHIQKKLLASVTVYLAWWTWKSSIAIIIC